MVPARQLSDKEEILAFLVTDRLYAAYAIGDLEPGMFEQSSWIGVEGSGGLMAVVLEFRGLTLPVLFLMGDPLGLGVALESMQRPERAYLTCRAEHTVTTLHFYDWESTEPMWRMVLDRRRFHPLPGKCVQLGPEHAQALVELYAAGGGDAFHTQQLERGFYYGVFAEGRLVAAAGTHVVSPTHSVAALGNVFTHPHYRGRGFGAVTASAVTAELLRLGIRDIVLNVSQANSTAASMYERLGFRRYCAFLEGPARRREQTLGV